MMHLPLMKSRLMCYFYEIPVERTKKRKLLYMSCILSGPFIGIKDDVVIAHMYRRK